MDDRRDFLRHTLATLAYRGGKTIRDVPNDFAGFHATAGLRTPLDLLGHIGDLFAWAVTMAEGRTTWPQHVASDWKEEVKRFFSGLEALDALLESDRPIGVEIDRIFQGPIADALTHIGQLAMLRRMAGSPVRGENYYLAEIVSGRVGPEQADPIREFD